MKKLYIAIAILFSTVLLAAAGDRFFINTNQDKDIILQVNDGGVATDALKVTGATSRVTLGKSGETGAHTVNGGLSITGDINSSGMILSGGTGIRQISGGNSTIVANGANGFRLISLPVAALDTNKVVGFCIIRAAANSYPSGIAVWNGMTSSTSSRCDFTGLNSGNMSYLLIEFQ